MQITAIHNIEQHRKMLARVEELWDAKPNTNEHNELEVISILIEKYEDENYPIDNPDPVTAVEFYLQQNGLGQADLSRILESRSRASEFLNRKKDLSIKQIRILHKEMGISADILIEPVTA